MQGLLLYLQLALAQEPVSAAPRYHTALDSARPELPWDGDALPAERLEFKWWIQLDRSRWFTAAGALAETTGIWLAMRGYADDEQLRGNYKLVIGGLMHEAGRITVMSSTLRTGQAIRGLTGRPLNWTFGGLAWLFWGMGEIAALNAIREDDELDLARIDLYGSYLMTIGQLTVNGVNAREYGLVGRSQGHHDLGLTLGPSFSAPGVQLRGRF